MSESDLNQIHVVSAVALSYCHPVKHLLLKWLQWRLLSLMNRVCHKVQRADWFSNVSVSLILTVVGFQWSVYCCRGVYIQYTYYSVCAHN